MTQGPTDAPVHLGRYELLGEIASGGMATVFLARSSGAGGFTRLVAIKRLHPHLEAEEEFVRMFLDEARLAARIRHPNVVGTLDVEDRDGLYIVMEFIEGVTLLQLAREAQKAGERLPVPVAVRIALDTLAGLHAAHELRDENDVFLNLVHRDVSPQNILLGTDGTARLTDFGIAKASSRLSLTRDGQLKGKISYMAPEQTRRGEALDRRADVFAMGAVVWEVLAGRRLFHGESDVEVLNQLLFEPVPRLREFAPTLPSMLEGAVMKALERDASARYATAAQFAEALERATRMLGGAANHRVVASFVQRVAGERIARERSRISLGSIPPDAPLTGSLRASLTPAPAPTPSHVRPAFNAGAERPSVPRAKLRAPTMTGPVYAPPPAASAAPAEPAAAEAPPRPQTPASPLRARSRPPSSLRPPTLPAAPHGAPQERTFIPTVPPPPSPALPAVIEFDISEDPDAAPVPAPSPLRAATRPGLMPTPLPPSPAAGSPPTPDDSQRLPPIELSYQHVPAAPRLPHGDDAPMEADALDAEEAEAVSAALRSVPPAPIEPVRPIAEAPRGQALALKPEVPTLRPEALNPPESTRPAPVAPAPAPIPSAPAPVDDPPAPKPRVRTGLWVALAVVLVATVGTVVGLYAAGVFAPLQYPVADVRVRVRPPTQPDAAPAAAVDVLAAAAADVLGSSDGAADALDDATPASALDAADEAAPDDAVTADAAADAPASDATDDASATTDAPATNVDAGDDVADAAADDAAREERRHRRRHRRHHDEDE